jgi:hypothetical protein
MGESLDRVLALAGVDLDADPEVIHAPYEASLALGAQMLGDAFMALADKDDDGDDDDSKSGDTDNDSDHTSHATFKAMKKRGMPDAAAAKICAKADKKAKVAATMVGKALTTMGLVELSVTQAERDKAHEAGNSLPDKSYPINNAKQLHSAAILASSGHGDVKAAKALIRRRAKELGVSLDSLPGFGSSDSDDEKVAASMVYLAGPAMEPPLGMDHSGVMAHGNFTGSHRHPHVVAAAHDHPHFHNGDNHHGHHPGTPRHLGM